MMTNESWAVFERPLSSIFIHLESNGWLLTVSLNRFFSLSSLILHSTRGTGRTGKATADGRRSEFCCIFLLLLLLLLLLSLLTVSVAFRVFSLARFLKRRQMRTCAKSGRRRHLRLGRLSPTPSSPLQLRVTEFSFSSLLSSYRVFFYYFRRHTEKRFISWATGLC